MRLKAETNDNLTTVYNTNEEIFGELKIESKARYYESEIRIKEQIFTILQDKWEAKVISDNQTVYHIKTDKFWGTQKIVELDKEIRGVFGFTWGTQLRDSYKQTLLKIRTENQIKKKGNYIIQVDKENIQPIEISLTLYVHITGSIANQHHVFLYS